MKLLTQMVRKVPVLLKSQACEACSETFACEILLDTPCWCGEIKLSDENRQEIRAKYKTCLCRTCLQKASVTNSTAGASE